MHGFGGVVEGLVVGHVDEELGRGRIGVRGPGHGDGITVISQAIISFVLDGALGGFLIHIGVEAAALNHEGGDDPMEDGAVIKAALDILQKIGHRDRGLLRIQLHDDVAQARFQFYHGMTFVRPGHVPGDED